MNTEQIIKKVANARLRGDSYLPYITCDELEALVQEREALSKLADKWNLECDEMREDNKRLAAELEQIKAQEPVVWWTSAGIPVGLDKATPEQAKLYGWEPLITASPTAPAQPIPYSGAEENPPVFARRWSLARDGFGVQRDDEGCYVHIDDALSVLHQSAPAQPSNHTEQPLDMVKAQQPLSDKEISRLWSNAHNDTSDRMAFQVLARAIEQAHGIKAAP